MKYAFTLVHHHGEDGNAPEGRILRMSEARFTDLGPDGSKLVREATDEEVKKGWEPAFEKDTTSQTKAGDTDRGGEKQKPAPENKQAAAPANKAKA